ncbi:hypothetical protein QE152_g11004 [Popillia japonica]|uniref:Uncharacterized protein n=1 Tax=Popillia japonica TaxID=7064 RepID=A0AAW1LTD6_POPJA
MSTSTKICKGRILHSQAREIIANVLQFMKDEAANKCCTIPITNFKERLIAATKIAERTSRDIVKEADDVRLGAASGFSSPSKKRKRLMMYDWGQQVGFHLLLKRESVQVYKALLNKLAQNTYIYCFLH